MVRVKGKDLPVAIYEPLGLSGEVGQAVLEEMERFHQVVRAYRKQDWDQAEARLSELLKAAPHAKLYQVYAERVAYFREHSPGADWDGVFVFKTK